MGNGVWLEGKRKVLNWIATMIFVPLITTALVKGLIWAGVAPSEAAAMAEKISVGLVGASISYLLIQGRIDNTKAKNGSGGTPTP